MLKRWLLTGVVLALLFGVPAGLKLFEKHMTQQFFASFTPPPVTISAESVRLETWQPRLTTIGSLTAIQGVELKSEVKGIVRDVIFQSGEQVSAGQPLLQLDDQTEQANLKSYKARLKLAQLTYDRDRALIEKRAISQTQFDQSAATLDEASAAVAQTEAMLRKKNITAPFSGTIGIQRAEPGDYLSEGDKIATLQDLSRLYIDFSLPEQAVPNLFKGQAIRFQVPAHGNQWFTGAVDAINAKVNSDTRYIDIRGVVNNGETQLLPGMFADIEIILSEQVPVVTVPETAVTYTLYGDSVYVIQGKEDEKDAETLTVKRTFVRTGERQQGRVAITEGLDGSEQVVTSGQLKLDNGARVVINNSVQL